MLQASPAPSNVDVLQLAERSGDQVKASLAEAARDYVDPLQGVFSKLGSAFSGNKE